MGVNAELFPMATRLISDACAAWGLLTGYAWLPPTMPAWAPRVAMEERVSSLPSLPTAVAARLGGQVCD